MSSDYSELHAELRSVVRRLLAQSPQRDGGSVPTWSQLADSGSLGLEVPIPLGGAGATFAEVAVVLQELGRTAATSAYVGSAVLGVGALAAVDPSPGRDRLLCEVAAGRTKVAVALPVGDDDPADAPFTLESAAAGSRLSGHASFVLDAPGSDRMLVVARAGPSPVLVDVDPAAPGVSVHGIPVVDPTRRLGSVTAAGATVGNESVWPLSGPGNRGLEGLRNRGAVAIACDSLGIAEAMLEATVSYTSVREQFGRPIGSFQAVQHACADMLVQISLSRELLATAVAALVVGDEGVWAPVAMAKSHVCSAAVAVTGKAMQLHGGIGYTWESGIHAFLKRAALNRSLFGSPGWHRRRLGQRYVVGAVGMAGE
jgi:alkylation response protein AidB-like acyl-CoA dehydrogenase